MTDNLSVHIDRATTDEDWARLDPNSWGITCSACGSYRAGQFAEPAAKTDFGSCECGETRGSMESPAGASHLALWDPRLP